MEYALISNKVATLFFNFKSRLKKDFSSRTIKIIYLVRGVKSRTFYDVVTFSVQVCCC